jgi:digeranylgeranylglycerophospholipid reductase
MEQIEKIIIIGGGPAGAYCAFCLASKGIYPIILDHSHPREKPCGGRVQAEIIKKFPVIEQILKKKSTITNLKMIFDENSSQVIKFLRGYNVSRKEFDKNILRMAIKKGAILIKERVLGINRIEKNQKKDNKTFLTDGKKKNNYWIIKTNKRLLKTKILVGADGTPSLVRRQTIGPISKQNLAVGYGYFATGTEEEISVVKFLKKIPGYIWIFPRKENENIGIGSELKYKNQLKKILHNYMVSNYPKMKIVPKSQFKGILPYAKEPEFFTKASCGEDWILIGDAAGHVNPINGEGIPYALWSAKIASEAIQEGNLKKYHIEWTKQYGNKLISYCKSKIMKSNF